MSKENIRKTIAYIEAHQNEFNQGDPAHCIVGNILKACGSRASAGSDAGKQQAANLIGVSVEKIRQIYVGEWGAFTAAYQSARRGTSEARVAVDYLKSLLGRTSTTRSATVNHEKAALKILVQMGKVTQAAVNAALRLAKS